MISDDLKKIFEEDDSGLLDVPDKPIAQTSDERLVNSFLEIVAFYDNNGHPPRSATSNISERRLYSRLEGMRADSKKADMLKDFDKYDLLTPVSGPGSIDDILDDDSGLLDDDTGILTIRNVPQDIRKPEYIGRQRHCEDFETFEPKFITCHQELRDNKRKIVDYTHQSQIKKGQFFVLRGVLIYVDKVGDREKSANGLEDARLRLIYENGTESDILLLSLSKALFLDGRLVTAHSDKLLDNFKGIAEDDVESGYIYVLKTLSEYPVLAQQQDLYKIGFSTRPVEERIINASKDPTYLMAPVKIIATYKCYNMSTQKFEHLLHRVFSKARLNLEVIGLDKEKYIPDEWFIVPLEVIDQAVSLIISDEIINYRYDYIDQKIKPNTT